MNYMGHGYHKINMKMIGILIVNDDFKSNAWSGYKKSYKNQFFMFDGYQFNSYFLYLSNVVKLQVIFQYTFNFN